MPRDSTDRYADFAELARQERAGVDYRIRLSSASAAFAIVAPHGGGIEPGTSELAEAVAGERLSFYAFEGLKRSGNAALHVTSTRFDEPLGLALVARCDSVLTLHGEQGLDPAVEVHLGGLDEVVGARIGQALGERGFRVRRAVGLFAGREPENLCNRGRSGRGVQLELSRALRESAFESFSARGRTQRTTRFHDLVQAIVVALASPAR
ncbi:MAG: hypothetical protein RL685_4824 [Pseudomonadota bacterium]|jgi:phage replication-related protein YjqB (UPF0714/DUF867 family)